MRWLESTHRACVAALLALSTLAGCGAGDPQMVRTGGTGAPKSTSVTVGVIEGLGSIVVNGIRYDETGARVTIDGVPDRPVSELRLGMVAVSYTHLLLRELLRVLEHFLPGGRCLVRVEAGFLEELLVPVHDLSLIHI